MWPSPSGTHRAAGTLSFQQPDAHLSAASPPDPSPMRRRHSSPVGVSGSFLRTLKAEAQTACVEARRRRLVVTRSQDDQGRADGRQDAASNEASRRDTAQGPKTVEVLALIRRAHITGAAVRQLPVLPKSESPCHATDDEPSCADPQRCEASDPNRLHAARRKRRIRCRGKLECDLGQFARFDRE